MTRIDGTMNFTNEQREQIFEVEKACFKDFWSLKMLSEELDNPLCDVVTRQCDEKIIAYAIGRTAADEGEIFRVGVLPEYRRGHIALEMLDTLHERMKTRGAARVFLEVRSKNSPAIRLYGALGYKKIAVRKNYYGDDDAVVYQKEL